MQDQFGTDCVGRNPTDRRKKAAKLEALVDDKGILIALVVCQGANVHDTQTVAPTIQSRHLPISGVRLYADKNFVFMLLRQ